jgi:hypothetical protein
MNQDESNCFLQIIAYYVAIVCDPSGIFLSISLYEIHLSKLLLYQKLLYKSGTCLISLTILVPIAHNNTPFVWIGSALIGSQLPLG